jgi:nucleoside-diphosphate-sugar epimerase
VEKLLKDGFDVKAFVASTSHAMALPFFQDMTTKWKNSITMVEGDPRVAMTRMLDPTHGFVKCGTVIHSVIPDRDEEVAAGMSPTMAQQLVDLQVNTVTGVMQSAKTAAVSRVVLLSHMGAVVPCNPASVPGGAAGFASKQFMDTDWQRDCVISLKPFHYAARRCEEEANKLGGATQPGKLELVRVVPGMVFGASPIMRSNSPPAERKARLPTGPKFLGEAIEGKFKVRAACGLRAALLSALRSTASTSWSEC